MFSIFPSQNTPILKSEHCPFSLLEIIDFHRIRIILLSVNQVQTSVASNGGLVPLQMLHKSCPQNKVSASYLCFTYMYCSLFAYLNLCIYIYIHFIHFIVIKIVIRKQLFRYIVFSQSSFLYVLEEEEEEEAASHFAAILTTTD